MTTLMQLLLVLLLQSTVLLLLGLVALHLTRQRGPSVQTLVGRASLANVALLVLLLPLTGHVQPVWRLPAPHQEPTPVRPSPALPVREGEELPPVGVPLATPSSQAGQTRRSAITLRPPLWGGPLRSKEVGPAPGNSVPSRLLRSKVVGCLWVAVSTLLLLWLGVCQRHLTRLRRAAQTITTGPALLLLAELTPNPPRLLSHPSVHSPFLAGYHHPAIFLPAAFETNFDADALRAIFVHELAHRDRRDNLWTLAARLLSALLWPQPLLWLLIRRLEHLSEDACDEAVLAQNCPPRAYADCLLSLATRPPLTPRQRTLNAGVAPFRSSVGRRISRILTAKGVRPMSPITLRLRFAAAALIVAAALGGAFLVSSAPAQTAALTLAEPGALAGIWTQTDKLSSSPRDVIIFGPQGEGIEFTPGNLPSQYFHYATNGSNITVTLTHMDNEGKVEFNPPPHSKTYRFSIMNGMLAIFRDPGNAPETAKRISDYPAGASLDAVAAQQVALFSAPSLPVGQVSPDQARFLAGLTPVQGPGVIVTLTDSRKRLPTIPPGMTPPNLIHDADINQVVNELKAAGAEAIAVNNQRLVAISAVRTAGQTILINNAPQAVPYTIEAIGNPKTLAGALMLPGGIADQIKTFDPAMIKVQEAPTLTLPAYTSADMPRYARPVGEVNDFIHQKVMFLQKTLDTRKGTLRGQREATRMKYFEVTASISALNGQLQAIHGKAQGKSPVLAPAISHQRAIAERILNKRLMESTRREVELRSRLVILDAQIAQLNRIASSHQVH